MVERSLLFFVGRCANLKLCARKILLCVTEHLCLEIPQKKSNAAYHFSLAFIVKRQNRRQNDKGIFAA